MSRITKQIAEDVSKAMTATHRSNAKQLQSEFKDKVREIAVKRVPQQVMELFENSEGVNPYISTTNSVRLYGHGFDGNWISTQKDFPHKSMCTANIELSKNEGQMLWELETNYKKAKDRVDQLQDEIYNALYCTLKSYKNVEKHFPEAYEHLPRLSTSTALTINLDKLRKKIK